MTILKHEIAQNRISLAIWTCVIAFMLGICIIIYPEMSGQMGEIGVAFSNMGGFSAAFGMDKINFGEFTGFFGVECGNVLGLGGAFFAALISIMALAKEEKEHTAEFLLTHPISRTNIVCQKLISVFVQILILNAASICITAISTIIIGESPEIKPMAMMFAVYFIMQLETAAVCFGISAFIGSNGSPAGLGLGLAAAFYFMNIISNLSEDAAFLKYITPFGYTDCAKIITEGSIEVKYLVVGLIISVAGIMAAFIRYEGKDIA